MRKFDPFGLYKQKSPAGYSFSAITIFALNLKVVVYDNAGWIDRQLYLQLIDKYGDISLEIMKEKYDAGN